MGAQTRMSCGATPTRFPACTFAPMENLAQKVRPSGAGVYCNVVTQSSAISTKDLDEKKKKKKWAW